MDSNHSGCCFGSKDLVKSEGKGNNFGTGNDSRTMSSPKPSTCLRKAVKTLGQSFTLNGTSAGWTSLLYEICQSAIVLKAHVRTSDRHQ